MITIDLDQMISPEARVVPLGEGLDGPWLPHS